MSGYIGPAPVPQATQTRETFTATSGQTSFATAGYTVGFLDVYLNGVHLVDGDDYTASNGSDVVLSSGATAGDILEVVAYKPFEVVDQNFTGDFSVDTDTLFVDASTDNVGINNASPSSSLDVTGDAKVSGDLTVDTDTLYVDSVNNRVGIGTSSPDEILHIKGDSESNLLLVEDTSLNSIVDIKCGFSTKNSIVNFLNGSNSSFGRIDYDHIPDAMSFYTNSSEAMRIDSSGRVGIGTSNPATALEVETPAARAAVFTSTNTNVHTNDSTVLIQNTGDATVNTSNHRLLDLDYAAASGGLSSNARFIRFLVAGAEIGSISGSGSTTSYNTSSDERLKENIADAQPASDLIDGIQVREFDWKADGEHQRYGMVAQELETVAPEAVTKGETEDDMWSVDYSKLVPMLVKEIQDLRKRVNELENAQ